MLILQMVWDVKIDSESIIINKISDDQGIPDPCYSIYHISPLTGTEPVTNETRKTPAYHWLANHRVGKSCIAILQFKIVHTGLGHERSCPKQDILFCYSLV